MVDRTVVNIQGAAQLEAFLRDLPPRIAKTALQHSLNAGAAIVVDAFKTSAPVGPDAGGKVRHGKNLGKLRDAIHRGTLNLAGASLTVGIGIGKAFWGVFDEFGTSRQAARPWLRPAWERVKYAVLNAIGRDLGSSIEREALKLAGEHRTRKSR